MVQLGFDANLSYYVYPTQQSVSGTKDSILAYEWNEISPVQEPVDGEDDGHILSRKTNRVQNHDHGHKPCNSNLELKLVRVYCRDNIGQNTCTVSITPLCTWAVVVVKW